MFERLTSIGKEEGIAFKFGGKTGNTLDSHRLIHLSQGKGDGVQDKVVNALFRTYFEEEGDITDPGVLIKAGLAAGMEEKEVRGYLESEQDVDAIQKAATGVREEGISGVPFFAIQGRYMIEGAQEPEGFVKVFERVAAEERKP